MTRRIIKCNERRRFVAFHFNCVGCGSDRLKAVCVDFPGGFCRVCIFGREIKTSAPRHGVYLTTAKEPQTQKKKPQKKLVHLTNQKPRAFFSHWILEPITFYSAAAASRSACCPIEPPNKRARWLEMAASLASLAREIIADASKTNVLSMIGLYLYILQWNENRITYT